MQSQPVLLNLEATIERAIHSIGTAVKEGAELVVGC
jgi:predicted amidohydrolase